LENQFQYRSVRTGHIKNQSQQLVFPIKTQFKKSVFLIKSRSQKIGLPYQKSDLKKKKKKCLKMEKKMRLGIGKKIAKLTHPILELFQT